MVIFDQSRRPSKKQTKVNESTASADPIIAVLVARSYVKKQNDVSNGGFHPPDGCIAQRIDEHGEVDENDDHDVFSKCYLNTCASQADEDLRRLVCLRACVCT